MKKGKKDMRRVSTMRSFVKQPTQTIKQEGLNKSVGTVSKKFLNLDSFGEKFSMKLEAEQEMLPTWAGSLSTIIMFLAVAAYSYLKTDILINKKGFDIFQSDKENHFSATDRFSYENNFNMAVAFTAYDSEKENILDPTIGQVVFKAYEWGPDPETGDFYSRREEIPSHMCTREELGLERGEKSQFLPIHSENVDEVSLY